MPNEEQLKAFWRDQHARRMAGLDAHSAENATIMSPEEQEYLYAPPVASPIRAVPPPEQMAPAMQAQPGPTAPTAAPPMVAAQTKRPGPTLKPKTLEEQADEMAAQISAEHKAAMERPTAVQETLNRPDPDYRF
jgi:hypothetical protein